MKYVFALLIFLESTVALSYAKGLVKPKNADKEAVFLSPRPVDLPEEYDLRALGLVSPIRNQGSCGSCWAFGTADALESNALVQGGPSLFLSTQQLVNCQYYGCGGGYFAFDYVMNKGVTDAKSLPYTARDGRCKENFDTKHFVTSWYRLGTSRNGPTVEEVKTAIYKYGAVAVTVAARSWGNYQGGVKQSCSKSSTDHIVTLVGWRKDNTWILKNSWGTGWGEKGFGYFPFGCNYAGSEEAAVGVYKNANMLQEAQNYLRSNNLESIETEEGTVSITLW